jgi:metal-responsive CopG/Arc/MetJ family transcriptional regulator
MSPRKNKNVLVKVPEGMLHEIAFVCLREHRSRVDLIREALRKYINDFKRNNPQWTTTDNSLQL